MLKAEVRHVDRGRRNKIFSEEEVRVKAFLIEEVKIHPNLWRKWGSGVPGKRAGSQGGNSIDKFFIPQSLSEPVPRHVRKSNLV